MSGLCTAVVLMRNYLWGDNPTLSMSEIVCYDGSKLFIDIFLRTTFLFLTKWLLHYRRYATPTLPTPTEATV